MYFTVVFLENGDRPGQDDSMLRVLRLDHQLSNLKKRKVLPNNLINP